MNTIETAEEPVQITARVAPPVKKTIKRDAVESGISSNAIFGLVMTKFLADHPTERERLAFYRTAAAK